MEEQNFTIKYSFNDILRESPLGEDPNEFVNEIEFIVFATNDHFNEIEQIAKGKISQILFSLAMDSHFPLHDVMDATHSICQMSGVLFEWDENKDVWDKIDTYYDFNPLNNYDVFFLETLEVISKYRGKGVGAKIVKNLIERFYSSCGLWVLKAYPMQHDVSIKRETEEKMSDWNKKMEYPKMELNFEKAQFQLFNYYKKMGFQNPFDMEYFIARPLDLIDKN